MAASPQAPQEIRSRTTKSISLPAIPAILFDETAERFQAKRENPPVKETRHVRIQRRVLSRSVAGFDGILEYREEGAGDQMLSTTLSVYEDQNGNVHTATSLSLDGTHYDMKITCSPSEDSLPLVSWLITRAGIRIKDKQRTGTSSGPWIEPSPGSI